MPPPKRKNHLKLIDIVDRWPGKASGWLQQQPVVIECDPVARKRWLLGHLIRRAEWKILIVWITLQITKNSHFHSPTPEDVEENMYVCQPKRLEMFPLTFQKWRFDERPASSRVLRRHAEKANVFIQNWPFARN